MPSTEAGKALCIAFVGRLTGPKGALARRLSTKVFGHFPQTHFLVVGGPLTDELKKGAAGNVTFTGWRSGLEGTFAEADLVIGSGRVALEALKAGVPVYAVGEACRAGFVETATFDIAARSNFGDCGAGERVDTALVIRDLTQFHKGMRPATEGIAQRLRDYEGNRVAAAVEQSYIDALVERRLKGRELPILCYHRVVPEPPPKPGPHIHVTTAVMDAHLRQLRQRGMQPITFTDLVGDRPLPRRPVILTFDDGYRDNYQHLLPLLERHKARAVIFALGERTLQSNAWDAAAGNAEHALMSDEELRACHASGRVEIGSHGLSHAHLPDLNEQSLARDVQESKARLEALIGTPIISFAYPYGEYGTRERDAVESAGYTFGVATDRGEKIDRDRYAIARRIVFPSTRGFGFYKKSSRWYPTYRRMLGRS